MIYFDMFMTTDLLEYSIQPTPRFDPRGEAESTWVCSTGGERGGGAQRKCLKQRQLRRRRLNFSSKNIVILWCFGTESEALIALAFYFLVTPNFHVVDVSEEEGFRQQSEESYYWENQGGKEPALLLLYSHMGGCKGWRRRVTQLCNNIHVHQYISIWFFASFLG